MLFRSLNGDTVNNKIAAGGLLDQRLKEGKTPQQIIEELYLRTLTRKPTDKEMAALNGVLVNEKDPKPVLEDVFWSLLNSREFVFNH